MMNRTAPKRPAGAQFPLTLITLALLSLSGCAVGPDYQRPEGSLPTAYASASASRATPAASVVEKEWWKHFQDETLNTLVAQAQKQNFDLLAAVARVEEAEGLAREAGANFLPQFNLNGSNARSRISTMNATPVPSTVPNPQNSRKAGISTSFELDLWGKLRRANESARASLLASRYAQDTLEISVAGLVTSSYLSLRAADASLSMTQNTLDSRRKSLEIVRNKFNAGSASPLDAAQAEGSLAVAEAQIADLRRQRTLALNQLALLTAQPDLVIAAGDLRQLPIPPVPPAGLPSTLLEARPDVRQAEETLVSMNAQIGVAKAALYPSLSLTGSLGSESAALSNLFKGAAGVWSLGESVTMPIFDFGRNSARIDQATAKQRQSLVSYQKTVQTAFKEVNDALISLREYAEADTAQERRVQSAEKVLKLAQIRYEAGYIGFLDVLDAQRTANDALIAFVTTRQARLGSAVDLFKALGGGWKDDFLKDSPAAAALARHSSRP